MAKRQIKKAKDSSAWDKYEKVLTDVGPAKLLEEMTQVMGEDQLNEVMDQVMRNFDYDVEDAEYRVEDAEGDEDLKTVLEELASYLNTKLSDRGLEIEVDYTEDKLAITCTNYLDREEQQSLEDLSYGFLREKLTSEDYDRVVSNRNNNAFYLEIE